MLNLVQIKFGSIRSNCQIKFSTKFSSYTVYGREDKFVQADTNQYHAVTASYYFVVLAATSAENWIISILVIADQVSLQILILAIPKSEITDESNLETRKNSTTLLNITAL